MCFTFNSDCLTSANATVEVITPILTDIVSIIGVAVTDLKALVGADISVILCSVDGTVVVAVSVVAQLLADILIALFGALGFVLTVVADVSILVDAIVNCGLGSIICDLLTIVFQLVDGLLAALIPLVLSLVDVIFADVAQPDQARIVALNAHHFLKNDGHVVISIKANCIDSTAPAEVVFAAEVKKLQEEMFKPLEQLTLEPYERVSRLRPFER